MDYKRVLNAFCGAADITLCGLPHAEGAKYVPPTAEVTVFALEKGFAISADTDNNKTQGTGNTPGDNWKEIDAFNWGSNDNYNE